MQYAAGRRRPSITWPTAAMGRRSTSPRRPDPGIGYDGQYWDAYAGSYYCQARWYSPSTGRYQSEDPTGFSAGDANLYRYVFNDPVNFVDPTGEQIAGKVPMFRRAPGHMVVTTHWAASQLASPALDGIKSLPGAVVSTFDSGEAADSYASAANGAADSIGNSLVGTSNFFLIVCSEVATFGTNPDYFGRIPHFARLGGTPVFGHAQAAQELGKPWDSGRRQQTRPYWAAWGSQPRWTGHWRAGVFSTLIPPRVSSIRVKSN